MQRESWPHLSDAGRIVVTGTTGSGKTTLAGQLARHLNAPRIELDAPHWGPDWTPVPTEEFRARVAAIVAGERWVADGNYSAVRDILWPRADTLIWLDYPLVVNYWRLLRRGTRRVVTREELWHGNRESFREMFLSRQSLFVWALQTHERRAGRARPAGVPPPAPDPPAYAAGDPALAGGEWAVAGSVECRVPSYWLRTTGYFFTPYCSGALLRQKAMRRQATARARSTPQEVWNAVTRVPISSIDSPCAYQKTIRVRRCW